MEQFDVGNRGGWGAVKLSLHLRGWCVPVPYHAVFVFVSTDLASFIRHLASPGALIMICTVAIDICAQNSVTYQPRTILTATATIDHVLTFQSIRTRPSISDDNGPQMLDMSMTGAMYQGLPGRPSQLIVGCPTGNCSYDPFISLALRSKCNDISEHMYSETLHNTYGNPSPFCSLSNRLQLSQLVPEMNVSSNLNLTSELGPRSHKLASFGAISPTQAYECSIYCCIDEHHSEIINGNLSEKMVNTWDNRFLNGSGIPPEYAHWFNGSPEDSSRFRTQP